MFPLLLHFSEARITHTSYAICLNIFLVPVSGSVKKSVMFEIWIFRLQKRIDLLQQAFIHPCTVFHVFWTVDNKHPLLEQPQQNILEQANMELCLTSFDRLPSASKQCMLLRNYTRLEFVQHHITVVNASGFQTCPEDSLPCTFSFPNQTHNLVLAVSTNELMS